MSPVTDQTWLPSVGADLSVMENKLPWVKGKGVLLAVFDPQDSVPLNKIICLSARDGKSLTADLGPWPKSSEVTGKSSTAVNKL